MHLWRHYEEFSVSELGAQILTGISVCSLLLWVPAPGAAKSRLSGSVFLQNIFLTHIQDCIGDLSAPKTQGCTILLGSDEHHWRHCLWDSSSSWALSSSTARVAGAAPEEHWSFLLHLESHTWNAWRALSVGCSARSRCWETNLSLGCWPVFCWSDGELWQRLPSSRASWQSLPQADMLAGLNLLLLLFYIYFACLFLLDQTGGPPSLLAPSEWCGSGELGCFCPHPPFTFQRSGIPSILRPLTFAMVSRAAAGWNDGTILC